jgi:two-component system, OmpR family, copper resistance phosphate regulon response regulator CusR
MRILVVEDYVPLRRSLVRGLREAGYAVDEAGDGEDGLAHATSVVYDVVVLDIMLPGTDGFEFIRRLRAGKSESRVLVLTARNAVDDRVRALDLGADDYLMKPFAFDELKARVRALGRRKYQQSSPAIRVGDLEIDTSTRVVRIGGETVDLTAREYSILEVLATRRGQVVTRAEIVDRIYDFEADLNSNLVDVYVGYLRKKLERGGASRLIHTRRGFGYSLGEDP